MKYFLLLCFVVCSYTVNYAQQTLSGIVRDTQNNPIDAATIYIPQLQLGTLSNFDGEYTIQNIPNGTYTLVVSRIGYTTFSKKITYYQSNTISEDIILQESAVEMEAVIISTPFHKLQRDNVMRVERLATNELQRNGAVTLAEGITNIPGVSSISTGNGIGKPVIRGLSANRVLTYAQGVRLENQQFGDEHGLGINAAGVESIEVIKGPASLLYGSDALGGVLYINPERFAPANDTHADAQFIYNDNTKGLGNTIGFQSSGEQLKFLGRLATTGHSDYDTPSYRVTNSRFNEFDFKTGIRYQNEKTNTTVRYNYNQSNIGIPEEIGDQSTSRSLLEPFQNIDNHILSLENKLYFKNSSLVTKLGYLYNDRREFEDHGHEEEEGEGNEDEEEETEIEDPALQLKLRTYNYDVKYNLPELGRFETIIGLQGMYQTNRNLGEEILIPDAETFDIGVLGTTHYHLEKVDIQAGVRYDRRTITSSAFSNEDGDLVDSIDRDFSSITASLGTKFDLIENLTTRINLASGYRAPNLAELTSNGVHEGTNRYEIGNPNLENEQNYQVDVALSYSSKHVEFFVNGFYNAIDNYIFISPTGAFIDDNNVFEYLQTNSNLYGGEVGFHLHPHPLDWLHIESSFESVTGKQENDSYLPLIPANSFTNVVRVELKETDTFKQTELFTKLNTVMDQNNISSFETKTEGYNLLSVGIASTIRIQNVNVLAGITATNLTDEKYISHLSRLKNDGIFNPGRNINVRLALKL